MHCACENWMSLNGHPTQSTKYNPNLLLNSHDFHSVYDFRVYTFVLDLIALVLKMGILFEQEVFVLILVGSYRRRDLVHGISMLAMNKTFISRHWIVHQWHCIANDGFCDANWINVFRSGFELIEYIHTYTPAPVYAWPHNIAIVAYGCRVEIEFAFKINHKSCLLTISSKFSHGPKTKTWTGLFFFSRFFFRLLYRLSSLCFESKVTHKHSFVKVKMIFGSWTTNLNYTLNTAV